MSGRARERRERPDPGEATVDDEEVIETYVLGGSGYVAGELLRLLSGHPRLEVTSVSSRSSAGLPLVEVFPFLALRSPPVVFVSPEDLRDRFRRGEGRAALFSCLPHGSSAARVAELLQDARAGSRRLHVVDLSADFRLPDAGLWEAVYGSEHAAPEVLPLFSCALPDLTAAVPTHHVAHPGCFTTAVTLGAAPLLGLGLIEPEIIVDAVTGSTGSGRQPGPGTHHPDRHASLRAYKPLVHRHRVEMERLLTDISESEAAPVVHFVPHSGPFSRGIHATLHARLVDPMHADEVALRMRAFYEGSPFVSVQPGPVPMKSVVGTNLCRLGVSAEGERVVVTSVIDNLTKGAAGGALQWMNRLFGLSEELGLDDPAPGWL